MNVFSWFHLHRPAQAEVVQYPPATCIVCRMPSSPRPMQACVPCKTASSAWFSVHAAHALALLLKLFCFKKCAFVTVTLPNPSNVSLSRNNFCLPYQAMVLYRAAAVQGSGRHAVGPWMALQWLRLRLLMERVRPGWGASLPQWLRWIAAPTR